jgi:hypothetical protein
MALPRRGPWLPGVGPLAECEPQPWSRSDKLALAGLCLLVLGALPFLVHPWYDAINDASMYISLARSLLAGDGYTYLGQPHIIRPPGFSLLIAPVIAWAGVDFHVLNAFVSLIGALGVVLLFVFQRPRLGWGLALLTAVAVWLNPGYQRLGNSIMADVPGTTLLLAVLLLDRWAARSPSWRRDLALGLAVGVSAYVRSLLILLVPAIAVSRILLALGERRPWRRTASILAIRLVPFACAAVLVVLPWKVRDAVVAPAPPADQTRLYSYGTAMWHVDPGDPDSPTVGASEILSRAPLRARQIAHVLGSRLAGRTRGKRDPEERLTSAENAVAVALVACTLVVLVRRRAPAELFATGSLVVMLVYFGFADRLLLPVYVVALPAGVEVLRDGLRRASSGGTATAVTAAALLLLIALDLQPRQGWQAIEAEHRELQARAHALAAQLEPGTRLGAGLGFHYMVLLDRPVYSLLPAMNRLPGPPGAEQMIGKYQLDAVLVSPERLREASLPSYLESRYGPPVPVGSALLWRLTPPGSR